MSRGYDGFITIDGMWHRGLNRHREPLQWFTPKGPASAWDADRYEESVSALLDMIFLLSHTGAAVRECITQDLYIVPFVDNGANARASHAPYPLGEGPEPSNYHARFQSLLSSFASHGTSHGRARGPVGQGVSVCNCSDRRCMPWSFDLYISFTPYNYMRRPPDDCSGNSQTEVLLHEMVHSIRRMASLPLVPHFELYDNMDEFAAILVTNYYSAEHGRGIRNSHRGNSLIRCAPNQWLNARVSPNAEPNRHYLEIFCNQQPELANQLADSPQTTFNPIRQMRN